MKKYIYLLALLVSACASPEETQKREQQYAADIAAIGAEGQSAYFACLYDDHVWECRQKIWETHPKPHIPGHESRDFILRYLDVEERKGAENILKAEGQSCGEVKALDYSMWHDGRYAECGNGREYQILRDSTGWRITQIGGGQ